MAGRRSKEVRRDHDPEKERPMTQEEMIELDLKLYGVCYTYQIDGKVYRLDPRFVYKKGLKKK